jgi:hypothetical protein
LLYNFHCNNTFPYRSWSGNTEAEGVITPQPFFLPSKNDTREWSLWISLLLHYCLCEFLHLCSIEHSQGVSPWPPNLLFNLSKNQT